MGKEKNQNKVEIDKKIYKVTLEKVGMKSTFETCNKKNLLECWKKKEVLKLHLPNGDIFSYRLGEFDYMSIELL